MIKHLMLLKTQNMIDIKNDLIQCSIHFLVKNHLAVVLEITNF